VLYQSARHIRTEGYSRGSASLCQSRSSFPARIAAALPRRAEPGQRSVVVTYRGANSSLRKARATTRSIVGAVIPVTVILIIVVRSRCDVVPIARHLLPFANRECDGTAMSAPIDQHRSRRLLSADKSAATVIGVVAANAVFVTRLTSLDADRRGYSAGPVFESGEIRARNGVNASKRCPSIYFPLHHAQSRE
jgi:hypothetical protein